MQSYPLNILWAPKKKTKTRSRFQQYAESADEKEELGRSPQSTLFVEFEDEANEVQSTDSGPSHIEMNHEEGSLDHLRLFDDFDEEESEIEMEDEDDIRMSLDYSRSAQE